MLTKSLDSIPDAWDSYKQCGPEFDGLAFDFLRALQVVVASSSSACFFRVQEGATLLRGVDDRADLNMITFEQNQ